MRRHRPTVATVDLSAIRHNIGVLRAAAGGAEMCAVVKADAYGHGAVPVARACLEAGASHLAVATLEEAAELRDAGIEAPVLLLSEPPVSSAPTILRLRVEPLVYTEALAEALAALGTGRGRAVPVHLAFDTGMGRVGVERSRWASFITSLPGAGLDVRGVWSHLARADEPDVDTTTAQLDAFDELLGLLSDNGVEPGLVHVANSAAILLHPRATSEDTGVPGARRMVRGGIAIYGLSPADELDAADHDLRPALSLTTEVAFVKRVPAGTPISYGHRWCAPTDGWVATLPIGYADGLPRRLTGQVDALHGGVRRPVVGTVTMDMVHLWCQDDEPAVGDEVVLLGEQAGDRLRVEDWARTIGTITYEITCQLTSRVPREYIG